MTRQRWVHLARLVWRIYGFAIVMALCAIIPGCNLLYSGHGGIAWIVALAVFPFTLYRLWRNWLAADSGTRATALRFACVSLFAYFPLSFVAATLGAASIARTLGLTVRPLGLWAFYIFPFGLPLMGGFFDL
jgi:hypothetical protein